MNMLDFEYHIFRNKFTGTFKTFADNGIDIHNFSNKKQMTKKYKHKNTGWVAMKEGNSELTIKREDGSYVGTYPEIMFENSNDWELIKIDPITIKLKQNKKYRLLRNLGSGKMGDEYIWNEKQSAYCLNGNDLTNCYISSGVENKPEWFEEVKEKSFEIISYGKNGSCGSWCKESGCHIYSIKRLSDGEIFTIGDSVSNNINTTSFYSKIEAFTISNKSINIDTLGINFSFKLSDIKKENVLTEKEIPGEPDISKHIWIELYSDEILKMFNRNKNVFSSAKGEYKWWELARPKFDEFVARMTKESKPDTDELLIEPKLKQPPLGLVPYWYHLEKRHREILDAMKRYTDELLPHPTEWACELYSIEKNSQFKGVKTNIKCGCHGK